MWLLTRCIFILDKELELKIGHLLRWDAVALGSVPIQLREVNGIVSFPILCAKRYWMWNVLLRGIDMRLGMVSE